MKRKKYIKCLDQVIKRSKIGDKRAKELLSSLKQYKPIKNFLTENTTIIRDGDVVDGSGNLYAR